VLNSLEDAFSGYEVSSLDGLKISFDCGWVLVRPSNTEPKMRIRGEADSGEILQEYVQEVEDKARDFIDGMK